MHFSSKVIGRETYYNVIRFALTNLINILTSIMSKQLFFNNFTNSFLRFFLFGLPEFLSLHWNTIPCSLHLQLFKLFGDLHILVKNTVFFVAGDLLDGLGVHPQHDAVGDESLPGGVVGDQLILGL